MVTTQVRGLTVYLVTDGSFSGTFGTAFVIHRDAEAAYLLTCAHVVRDVGIEKLKVGDYKPTTITLGEEGRSPDLAVLRVKELKDHPCWTLSDVGKKGKPFWAEGFYKDQNQYNQRKISGKLGEQFQVTLPKQTTHLSWDLSIRNNEKLRPGNSGSPVWDKKLRVIGVVSRRQVAGHEGMAISINALDALRDVWEDMPLGLIKKQPIDINPIALISGVVGLVASTVLVWTQIQPPLPTEPKPLCPQVSLQPSNEFSQPSSGLTANIIIAGSSSMGDLNRNLIEAFQKRFPGAKVSFTASGSQDGLNKLSQETTVDIAAASEHIDDKIKKQRGWQAFAIAPAPIAIVISASNPYPKEQGLTKQQVKEIYTGKIDQWSQLQPGMSDSIHAINRRSGSGTYREFQKIVLDGLPFTPVIKDSMDETEAVKALGMNGIYYAACHQVANQQSARILQIDGRIPSDDKYPFARPFLYVYKVDSTGKPSSKVSAFLGFVDSEEGRKIVQETLSVRKK